MSNKISKMQPRGELQRKRPPPEQRERETTTYKDPMAKCDKNSPPWTRHIRKIIEEMMDEEDIKDGTQSQARRKQTTHETPSTNTNKPKPTTKTTRPKKGMGETISKGSSTQGKYEQGDCKNHQPDSLEQELEATMPPTSTADSQPRAEQDASRKRSRNSLNEAI